MCNSFVINRKLTHDTMQLIVIKNFNQLTPLLNTKHTLGYERHGGASGCHIAAGWLLVRFPHSPRVCLASLQLTPSVQRRARQAKMATQNFPDRCRPSEDSRCATDFFPSFRVYRPWRHSELLSSELTAASLPAAWSRRHGYRRFYRRALTICSTSKVVTRLLRVPPSFRSLGPWNFPFRLPSALMTFYQRSLNGRGALCYRVFRAAVKIKITVGVAEGDWERAASAPQAASMDFSRRSIGPPSAVVWIGGFHDAQTLNLVTDRYLRLTETSATELLHRHGLIVLHHCTFKSDQQCHFFCFFKCICTLKTALLYSCNWKKKLYCLPALIIEICYDWFWKGSTSWRQNMCLISDG